MNSRDKNIVNKILHYCEEIRNTHAYFKNDKNLFFDLDNGFVYRNSINMPILQIGELSKNLSEEFRNEYSQIPWKQIVGMRDIYAHHYGSIDYSLAWETSISDISDLEEKLKAIIED